jgi:hypothetical protein
VRYTTDGAPTPTYTRDIGYTGPAHGSGAAQVGSFASRLAIDPQTGDLLIADTGNLRIERFDSTGAFVSSFDGSTTPSGAFTSLLDIATGPDGTIYLVADGVIEPLFGDVSESIVESFAADGSLHEVMGGPGGSPAELGNSRRIAYDTRGGNVLVTNGGGCFESRGILLRSLHAGRQVSEVEIPTPIQGTLSAGIAVPTAQSAPVSILSARSVEIEQGVSAIHAVKGITVDVSTPAVSAITSSGAHVAATVNPHGDSGSAQFEYRPAGSETWTANPGQAVSAETNAEPVDEDPDLQPNEHYEVRLTAHIAGFTTSSSVEEFTTLTAAPAAVTLEATGISSAGATLNGSVDPKGDASTWFFEYGATAEYGTRIPLAAAPAGLGRLPVVFSRAVSGLTPGATYHFRIVAANSAGTSQGTDRTFVATAGVSRAYEEVTPVDQGGVFADPAFGALALTGTSGITYITRPAGDGAASAPFNTRVLALRGATDWSNPINLDPKFSHPTVERVFRTTLGVSNDGTHTFIVTNDKLTPGALEGNTAANLYVEDIRNASLRLVAATNAPGALAAYTNAGALPETFIAGSEDFGWVDFYSAAPLLPGVAHSAVYRWTPTGLEVLSTLPDGSLPSPGVETSSIATRYHARRWVSNDGATLFFGVEHGPVYVRHGNVTVAASVSQIDGEPKPAEMIATDSTGRYAYFVSEALTLGAPEGPAVYRYDREENTVEYVDAYLGGFTALGNEVGLAVSPDGTSIAFLGSGAHSAVELDVWHDGELTSIEADATPVPEFYYSIQFSPNGRYLTYALNGDVYLYDVLAHEFTCASCRAGQPAGMATLPPGPVAEKVINNSEPEVVDDQGQVFFMSKAALTPTDTNGELDVYMFESGRASLVSPGNAPYAATLMDVSPNGQDVYFTTAQPLVARDTNRELDIYDARVGGGFAVQNQTPAVPCEGEECQGSWHGGPSGGLLSSEALSGLEANSGAPGSAPARPRPLTRPQKLANALKVCRAKRDRHRRQLCEKTARKRYGAKPKAKAKSHKGGK